MWNRVNGLLKSADNHYPTMTLDQIRELPVRELSDNDCALFLWVTWPFIFKAESVIKAWGFEYSGLAWEWLKQNPKTKKYAFGTGYGTRKNLEPCLLALRGNPKIKSRSERDFIIAPRQEHSRKPDEQYGKIERLYPQGPYLEMFARRTRAGWDCIGNGINGEDIRVTLERASNEQSAQVHLP